MGKEMTKDGKVTETAESKVKAEVTQIPKKEQKIVKESVYSAGELAAQAGQLFQTRQECVTAALKAVGKSVCTVSEAKEIVEKFLKKEVL